MSEREPQGNFEKLSPKIEHSAERHHTKHTAEKAPDSKETANKITGLRAEIGKEAKQSGDIKLDQSSEGKSQATPPVNRELKNTMRVRTLNRIRKDLPAPQRVLSRVVHTKPVEILSTAGEKTVARPAGILGGGLTALAGSAATLYMAKHYGFRYNLLLFILLFAAGYLVATVLELLVAMVKRAGR